MPPRNKQRAVEIRGSAAPVTCEQTLRNLPSPPVNQLTVRMASQFGANFFADVWAAITVGTVIRDYYPNLTIVAKGHEEIGIDTSFAE